MTKQDSALVEQYISKLSDEHVKFLNSRLTQRLSGDLPEALDFLSQNQDMDNWLQNAYGCFDLYDMLDLVEKHAEIEFDDRFSDAA